MCAADDASFTLRGFAFNVLWGLGVRSDDDDDDHVDSFEDRRISGEMRSREWTHLENGSLRESVKSALWRRAGIIGALDLNNYSINQ